MATEAKPAAMPDSTPLTENGVVHPSATVLRCRLGRYTEVGQRTFLHDTTMDDYSYIVNDGEVAYTDIGKHCSIAAHVRINPGNHPMWRASSSHFTYRASKYWPDEEDEIAFFDWRRENWVTIGHDVWIGHGAIVLPGRSIGTGAVVAAGAVVTKEVPAYTIVAGVPAEPVGRRFSEEIEEKLLAIGWWDWSHDELKAALPDFRALDVAAFCEKYAG